MIFKTRIKKSNFFTIVSVRKNRGVTFVAGPLGDWLGFLPQGTEVTGEVSFSAVPDRDIWMRLTEGPWRGYWIALVDAKGKVFVENVPVDPALPPVESRYAFVEHHINSKYWGYKNYMDAHGFVGQGDPSVYQWISTPSTKVVYMTKAMQDLVHGFNVQAAQGSGMTPLELKNVWKNLTAWNRALNNKKGTKQGFADYVQGINTSAKQGIGAQPVLITGSMLKLIRSPYKKYGVWCQDFEIADMTKESSYFLSWYRDWHLIPAVTNSYRAIVDANGKYVVDKNGRKEIVGPFPIMMGGRSTFWLYMGYGTNVGTTYADGLRYLDYVPTAPLWPYLNIPKVAPSSYESLWDMR